MGNLKETHNVFLKFSFQKHPLCFCGKTLWKSQHMSRNGFFWGKHHPVPAVKTNHINMSLAMQTPCLCDQDHLSFALITHLASCISSATTQYEAHF